MTKQIVQGKQQLSNAELELLANFRELDSGGQEFISRTVGGLLKSRRWEAKYTAKTGCSADEATEAKLARYTRWIVRERGKARQKELLAQTAI